MMPCRDSHDQRFDPWCLPTTAAATRIIEQAVADVIDHEQRSGLRKRARRSHVEERFGQAVTALLSDAMRHATGGGRGGLYVPRSKEVLCRTSRYLPAFLDRSFRKTLDLLQATGWLRQFIGEFDAATGIGHRTTVVAGPGLMEALGGTSVSPADFITHRHAETIVLKDGKSDYWDKGRLVEYDDTNETIRYRAEIAEVNDWLVRADLACEGYDTTRRRLYRSFTRQRFDSGGRLFGGFWQTMPKADRQRLLRIDGRKAVELDYDQIAPRILYAMCGQTVPPDCDLYAVPGLDKDRETVKTLVNAMLFADSTFKRKPKGTGEALKGITINKVVAAIRDAHAPISEHFFTGIGHQLQFIESQIMMALMLDLKDKGVVALPIHDAIMVAEDHVGTARDAMLAAFRKQTGHQGAVSVASPGSTRGT